MFQINDDLSIYVTRGDTVYLKINAMNNGKPYTFQAGDVLRVKVFGKKDCETVERQKDFPITTATQEVDVILDGAFTKIGEVISKPKDYWYEVELNPFDNPTTIIGYDEDGAKLFRLFPEGADVPEYVPDPEVIKVIDTELDMTSERPVQNQVIARAFANLQADYIATHNAVAAVNYTPEMFGAIGNGVADDTEAIQAAIDACKPFDTLRFLNKTYCVSEPIVLNKKVNIAAGGSVLKAIKSMECVLRLTNQGSLRPYSIERLSIDANGLATDAVKIGGDNHATQITFRECGVKNAVRHGFYLLPISYIVNFESCLSESNGEDGLNAVAPNSSEQINAININRCSFQRNGKSGLHVNGVSFSITECNSETNKYGITIGGVNYITYGVFITRCHLEYNSIASIYVDTKSSATVSITRSYFMQTGYSEATGATSFIKCSAASYNIALTVEENTFQGDSTLNYVDGGSKLGENSRIVVDNIDRLVNVRNARIEAANASERYFPLPMTLAHGAAIASCTMSSNLVDQSYKILTWVVPYELVNALPRLIGVIATTNGTTSKLRCSARKITADGSTVIQQTYYDVTVTANGIFTFNLLNNWGYKRMPNNAYMEIEFQLLDPGNASFFVLSNPYITAYV